MHPLKTKPASLLRLDTRTERQVAKADQVVWIRAAAAFARVSVVLCLVILEA